MFSTVMTTENILIGKRSRFVLLLPFGQVQKQNSFHQFI